MKFFSLLCNAFFVIPLLLISCTVNTKAQEPKEISSWIEKDMQSGETATFKSYFKNDSEVTIEGLSYEFTSLKDSKSGKSNIKQSGKFSAKPRQKITLSTIRLNSAQNVTKTFKLQLKIFHRDALIHTDSLIIAP